MPEFPLPSDAAAESRRLDALHSLHQVDTDASPDLDNITCLCKSLFGVGTSYISLIDNERQWIKSSAGGEMCSMPREQSFCHHTIAQADVLVIGDTLLDARFCDNPMVTAPNGVRFYAGAPLIAPGGHAIGALCLVDQTPNTLDAEKMAQLRRLAGIVVTQMLLRRAVGRVDALTGLPNETQLQEDLALLAQADSDKRRRVLVYIDMPDAGAAFDIASVLGSAVSDDLVRNVGARLGQLFAGKADVYHVSAARFAVLSRPTGADDFIDLLERIKPRLQEPVPGLTLPLNLACFGGIVVIGDDAAAEILLDAPRRAGNALRLAHASPARWAHYDATGDARYQRTFQLLNDIPQALQAQAGSGLGFALVYQPKLHLPSATYHGGEALLRWRHPTLGDIGPAEFIPLLEKTTLIRSVSAWVVETALAQLAQWHAQGKMLTVAVNLSARDFEDPQLPGWLLAACTRAGVAPRYLEIECTEGEWMQSRAVLDILNAIRALGFDLSLDDFGTGYSNFAYLQQVPASIVKIDQSLIRNLERSARDQRIVQALIGMAKELNYQVVAEGVETQEILDLVQAWGCDEAQGYLLAKPLPPEQFLRHVGAALA